VGIVVRSAVVFASIGLGAFVGLQIWQARAAIKPVSKPAAPPVAISVPPPSIPAVANQTKIPGVDASAATRPIALVLAGTTVGQNSFDGTASIGTSLDNSQTYGAGAILPNGARLAEVHGEYVVLERGSMREKLYVGATVSASANPARILTIGGESPVRPTRPPPLPKFATVIRSQPVYTNETLKGLRVDPGLQSGRFTALGLQAGDIVTAIDGARVESVEQIDDLIGALGSGAPVAVTIERDGHLEHLNLEPTS
jgi:general secretion pathway protein C